MKRLLTIALMLLLAASLLSAQETGKFNFPEYTKLTLDNGMTLYLMENHDAPLIFVEASYNAGAIFDGDKYGLAEFTSTSLMFGTAKMSKDDLEETIDFYGASMRTGAGAESANLSAMFATADQDIFMPMMRDMLVSPAFDTEEMAKYKELLKSQLTRAKESPNQVMGDYLARFLYADHPYGNPIYGTLLSLEKFDNADVKAFHAAHYGPVGTALVLVGDFETKAMTAKLEKLFGSWKNDAVATADPLVDTDFQPFSKPRVLLVDKPDARQTTYAIAGWGMKANNPDRIAANLVNTVLGGSFTSWLNSELRIERGLTYGARSGFRKMKKAGIFSASSYTGTPNTEQILTLTYEILAKLQAEGLTDAEISKGKNYIKGSFPRGYESPGSLANYLISMHQYGFDEDYINNFTRDLLAVSKEDVKRVIKQYFLRDNMQLLVIGQAEAIRDIVAKYGDVTELSIEDDEYLSK
jgi:zinc protease